MRNVKNSFIILSTNIIQLAVTLFTLPIYLNGLGSSNFGIYSIIWITIGISNSLDMGLGKAVNGKIANNNTRVNEYLSMGLWSSLLLGTIVAIFSYVIYFIVIYLLDLNRIFYDIYFVNIIVLGIIINLLTNIINSAFESTGKFKILNLIILFNFLLFQIIPLLNIIYNNGDIKTTLELGILCKSAGFTAVLLGAITALRFRFMKVSFLKSLALIRSGKNIGINSILSFILENIDKYILSITKGPISLTDYVVPFNSVTKIRIIPDSVAKIGYPIYSQRNRKDSLDICIQHTKMIAIVVGIGAIFISLFSTEIFKVWLQGEYKAIFTTIAVILVIPLWINSVAYPAYSYVEATGSASKIIKIYSYTSIFYVGLLIIFAIVYGPIGVALVWGLRAVIDSILLIIISGVMKKSLNIIFEIFIFISISILISILTTNLYLNIIYFSLVSLFMISKIVRRYVCLKNI